MGTGQAKEQSYEIYVKEHTQEWLNSASTSKDGLPRFKLVIPEYQVADGRLDFVAAGWKNDYQLDIIGVECKGKTNPQSLWSITSGQLSRYLRLVPELYFACISPSRQDTLNEYKGLCHLAKVGLLGLPEEKKCDQSFKMDELSEPARSPTAYFDEDDYLQQTRSRIVMYLSFKELFRNEIRMGRDWISTAEGMEEPQYNAFIANGAVWAGINIENAKAVLSRVQSHSAKFNNLIRLLLEIGEQREQCRFEAREVYAVGVGRRVHLPILQKHAKSVSEIDLKCICAAANKKALHVNICYPIWRLDEVLLRCEHQDLIDDVKNQFNSLYELLTDTT